MTRLTADDRDRVTRAYVALALIPWWFATVATTLVVSRATTGRW